MTIKKEMLAVNSDIKALTEKIDKLLKDFIKIEEPNVAKRAPKRTVRAKNVNNVLVKKSPAKKKRPKLTATDQALRIITKRKRGIDIAALIVVRLALLDCHTMFHEIFLILYDINDLYDLIGF
jgi:hypothetical protein